MSWMRLARTIGVLTVVIGVVHIGVAEMEYDGFSFDALWFVGSGLGVILIGTLTCLASSARAWPALRLIAVASNVPNVPTTPSPPQVEQITRSGWHPTDTNPRLTAIRRLAIFGDIAPRVIPGWTT